MSFSGSLLGGASFSGNLYYGASLSTPDAWTPSLLFAQGEQGAWYDPSDLTTLFQDAAGTTPVTAAGQVVGRILDKSGRGNHATQTGATSLMPIYRMDANGRAYLDFDGVDDGLQTSTITPGVDALLVVAGIRKNSDAATAMLVEFSPSTSANNGAFQVRAPNGAAPNYYFGSRGTVEAASVSGVAFAAPVTSVLSGTARISTDSNILRVNGTRVGTTAADQGTGNYGAHALNIGRRGGGLVPWNGRLYGLIVRFSSDVPSAATVAAAERWMNRKTGAF